MHSLSLLGVLSLLHFSTLSSAHLPHHAIEEVHGFPASHIQKRDWSTPDVDTKKQCGPGIGFCAPGDWYVHVGSHVT
jgi:hypothetical protein